VAAGAAAEAVAHRPGQARRALAWAATMPVMVMMMMMTVMAMMMTMMSVVVATVTMVRLGRKLR
jgi:bacteriorhodopsin